MKTYLFILLFSIIYGSPISAENLKFTYPFTTCSKTIQCGTITNITYPFYDGNTRPDYCGHPGFKLNCNGTTTPQITISNQDYNLLRINKSTNTITVSMNNFNSTNACPYNLINSTIDFSYFKFSKADQDLTFFYDCAQALTNQLLQTQCDLLGSQSTGYYLTRSMLETNNGLDLLGNCKSMILIPILQSEAELINKSPSLVALVKALKSGFELGLIAGITESCSSCVGSGGTCGYDLGKFVCYCADGGFDSECGVDPVKVEGGNRTAKVILFSVLSGSTTIILLVLFVYFKKGKIPGTHNSQVTRDNKNAENVLKSYASLTPKRYTYSNIRKMTSSFSEKLGEGGFGEVYKGKLNDGRLVAVKLLKSSKGNGEGFINEVASMGRTSHVNVITLLGFCLEGNKRALVYEYMANGSLQKFMHTEANINGNSSLPLDTLFQIVIGIARGLEYLHRGCVTRILHFDIKPHNILLDEEFFPKISDFGLAKVTPQDKQSRVSMSGARGTIGYIAPEVFCRSFGDVSHKSDVYSYGMMVLEVIGSRKRANRDQVENSSELYFPQWLYKELEHEEEVEIDITLNDTAKELKRKMIVVSLWCIQPLPSNRPSMSRVVQMLEGSLDSIEIPAMPLLSSPPRPRWDSSISSTMTT